MRWMVFVLSFVASPVVAEEYITHPRWDLTPGVIRDLSVKQICRTKWGEDARGVTAAMKQNVIDAYRFDVNQCPLTTFRGKRVRRLEIDHLIPRSIGGADDEKNLWPQCYEQVRPDKDEQENGAPQEGQAGDLYPRGALQEPLRRTSRGISNQDQVGLDLLLS